MYWGVPTICPAPVNVRLGASRPTSLAMPKSAILTWPSLFSNKFSGLMSRWTTPWSWAYCRASQICGTMASASRGASLPVSRSWRTFTPLTNSMMK